MTGKELVTLTLQNLGEDTDEAAIAEYEERILAGINEAYLEICQTRYFPQKGVEVRPEGGRWIPRRMLPHDHQKTIGLYGEKGSAISYVEEMAGIRLPVRMETVALRYVYVPGCIAMEDVPILDEIYHPALADYAAFRLLIGGGRSRQARGDIFYMNYMRRIQRITPQGADGRFINRY
ncbi:hypothetical protein LJC20_03705 [Eubacteriales bacterium OttesenSCG-928-M02]|nr:hypothetical protein [Eubacteriales bacterium OttesenSCG-928-M02]